MGLRGSMGSCFIVGGNEMLADFVSYLCWTVSTASLLPHPPASMILLLVFKLLCNPPLLECGQDLGFSSNQQNMAAVMDAAPETM